MLIIYACFCRLFFVSLCHNLEKKIMGQKLLNYFEQIEDPRVVGRCLHPLSDILKIAVCTYLTGGTDFQDMYLFCKERGRDLKGTFLELPNGTPSVDTFERVIKRLKPEALTQCLHDYGKELLLKLSEKQIVLDGKKLRGASPTSKGFDGIHILNAWVAENRICVGQQKIDEKSNEITAIPDVLDSLDIEDAIVSIDAIGTQTAIAEQIRRQKGHYLLSVKSNQKDLLTEIEYAFNHHKPTDTVKNTDKDHGRIETRRCSILPAKDFLMNEIFLQWKDLTTIVMVESTREIKGVRTEKTRYYISNEDFPKATYYQALVRDHWGIENHLHWHLDVTFNEDSCRVRTGFAAENLSAIRKFTLQIISNANDKLSMKKRQYKAAINTDYMKVLLGI
jgi:predicted transposase YbfD/YdcC